MLPQFSQHRLQLIVLLLISIPVLPAHSQNPDTTPEAIDDQPLVTTGDLMPSSISFPILFKPSVQVMILGMAMVPVVILPLLIKVALVLIKERPRPYGSYLFLAFQLSLLFLEVSFGKDASIFMVGNILISTGLTIEIRYRGLWNTHKLMVYASVTVTVVWYFVIVCIISSASV